MGMFVNTIDDGFRHVSRAGQAKRDLAAGKIDKAACDKICDEENQAAAARLKDPKFAEKHEASRAAERAKAGL